ncbi:MAG: formyl transferase [Lachnospiraceae bacterium]|nr:formyl transferase [Lachnospiraceae bacterium]
MSERTFNGTERKKVLFLTNNENTLPLYHWISERADCSLYSEPLDLSGLLMFHPDILVSYNYKYMIPGDVIEAMHGNALNLHVSYLPWNRGSSPNFWSFIENTPKGVSIHKLAQKLDKGDVVFQKELFFDENKETFSSSYDTLQKEIMELFKANWEAILNGIYTPVVHPEKGSYHSNAQLAALRGKVDFSWDETIAIVKERLNRLP